MKKITSLLFLVLFVTACNGTGTPTNCTSDGQTDCTTTTTTPTTTTPAVTDGTTTTPTTPTDGTITTPATPTDGNTTTPASPPDTTTDVPTPGDPGLSDLAYTFGTDIDFVNTTAEQQAKFDKAIVIIKKVVATQAFKDQVLNHTYNGQTTFVDNGGKTNAQIYQSILDAAESLQPAKNNTMDMEVELYYENNNVVGYTNGGTTRIWVNTKFFSTNAVTGVASNLVHEWLHKLGYTHAYLYSTSRDYSVPYAIGRIVGSIGKQFL